MEQILKSGRVVRAWLGVNIQPVTPQIAKAFGLDKAHGALVSDVVPDSPAARDGLANGDVIVELEGQSIEDSRDLQLSVARMKPGTKASLKVFRDGRAESITVTLGEMPEEQRTAGADTRPAGALEGVDVDAMTPQTARQLGLPPQTVGVVITNIRPDSAAVAAGLRRGDVIQEVNRKPVTNTGTFDRAIRQAGEEPVLLLVNRAGRTHYVVLEPR
jgi:serine protease Do